MEIIVVIGGIIILLFGSMGALLIRQWMFLKYKPDWFDQTEEE